MRKFLKENWKFLAFVIAAIIVLSTLVTLVGLESQNLRSRKIEFERFCLDNNVTLLKGRVESPSVIIVQDKIDFLNTIKRLGNVTVYYQGTYYFLVTEQYLTYYVFDLNYQIAYSWGI